MYTIKNIAERSLKKDLLEEFLEFTNKKLDIDQPYSVYFVDDKDNASDALGKTAMYNPSTNSVYVYVTNRHPKDILRSIAHELMHHKQNCEGRLDRTYGEGSDNLEKLELEANEAGYLVREFEDNRSKMNEGPPGYPVETPGGMTRWRKHPSKTKKPKLVSDFLFDLFAEKPWSPDFVSRAIADFENWLVRSPPLDTLRNNKSGMEAPKYADAYKVDDYDAAPGDAATLKVYGDYPKCLAGQEKRDSRHKVWDSGQTYRTAKYKRGKRCYPKDFSKNKKFYDFDGLGLKDFIAVIKDLKECEANNRTSVFTDQNKTLYFATVILPKLNKTIKNVKNAPKVPENYVEKNIERYYKIKEFAKKQRDKMLTTPSTPGGQIGKYLKEQSEVGQSEVGLPYYDKSQILDARRIEILFKDGIYEWGPAESPFRNRYPVPKNILDELKRAVGGDKRIDEIREIYSSQASAKATQLPEGPREVLDVLHFGLDVIGLSPDAAGIGIMADILNALIYTAEGRMFDATLSFASAAFFGDVVKVQRGPLVKAARVVSNFRENSAILLDETVIEFFVYIAGKLSNWIDTIALGVSRRIQAVVGGETGKKVAQKFVAEFPQLKQFIDETGTVDLKQFAEKLIEYRNSLKDITQMMRGEINPKYLDDIFENEETLRRILARRIQKSADEIAETGEEVANLPSTKGFRTKTTKSIDDEIKTAREEIARRRSALERFEIDPKLRGEIEEKITGLGKEVEELQREKDQLLLKGYSPDAWKKAGDIMKEKGPDWEVLKNQLRSQLSSLKLTGQFKEHLKAWVKKQDSITDAVTGAPEYIKKELPKFIEKQIELALGNSLSLKGFIYKRLPQIFGQAPGRQTVRAAAFGYEVIDYFWRFTTKNVFGSGGLAGSIYASSLGALKKLVVSLWKKIGWSSIYKIPSKIVFTWLIIYPILLLGKLSSITTIYVRWYRNFCGGPDDFIAVTKPILTNFTKFYFELPFELFTPGKEEDLESHIDNKSDNINLSSPSTYETIIAALTNTFTCKRRVEHKEALDIIGDKKLYALWQEFEKEQKNHAVQGAVETGKSAQEQLEQLRNSASENYEKALKAGQQAVDNVREAAKKTEGKPISERAKKIGRAIKEQTEKIIKDPKTTPEQKAAAEEIKGDTDRIIQGDVPPLDESILAERLIKVSIG